MKRYLLIFALASSLFAVTPSKDITSAGPLIHIWLGNDLSQQVEHTLDSPTYEFFPQDIKPADAGTFIATGGTLYAPDFENHDQTSADNTFPNTPFTPISQTDVTGSGTGGDPFTVVTVADAGATGLRITQTDTYVIGNNFYSTSILIDNTSGGTITGILYRAGDSFMGGVDTGYGFKETLSGSRNAVGCSANPNNIPSGKIEEWVPQTGGNNYFEEQFDNVWTAVHSLTSFNDTCICITLVDNGAGISWPFSILAGASATFSQDTVFVPSATPSPTPTPTATATATATPVAVTSASGYIF